MTTPDQPAASAPGHTSNIFASDKKWKRWANKGIDKVTIASDWAGGHANRLGTKAGVERFWPTTGDHPLELEKCEKILRLFCTKGLPTLVEEPAVNSDDKKQGKKADQQKHKVYRKIPPSVIKNAKGVVIFTAMRTSTAPFGGSGGGGLVVLRKPDGSWSQPSFICPNNLSAGFSFGLDVYNAVLILNTDAAVQGFMSYKVTVGAEVAIAAGPLGYGMAAESGIKTNERAPIFSYITTKGLYAGLSIVGQLFIHRPDENAIAYNMRDVKPKDIFEGRVGSLPGTAALHQALHEAETGEAQGATLEYDSDEKETEVVQPLAQDEGWMQQDQPPIAVETPAATQRNQVEKGSIPTS